MSKKTSKNRLFRIIGLIALIVFLIYFLLNSTSLINRSTGTFMIENGNLSYEEEAEGYIIRDEEVLKGNNYSNGISQIVTEGTRVAKNESVFRYYSNNEEDINNQILELDKQIDEALQNATDIIPSVDVMNLEGEIRNVLSDLYKENNMQQIKEYNKKINTYIVKKGEITGESSPAGSYIKSLVEQRTTLSNQLIADSETIKAPKAGLISYKVDGLEEIFKVNDENFDYLTTQMLDNLKLNVGASVPESKEVGKIVDNYTCYIACPINTENSDAAEIGEKLTLKLPDATTVKAEIVQINEEENKRIIIFKVTENVENLIEYRKISVDIIWWKYSGWKVSNSALIEKDDLTYIKRTKAGIEEEILVKVLRQNDTYSIVENYSDEELLELGYTKDQIRRISKNKII